MRTAYRWHARSFLFAFAVLLAVQAALLALGALPVLRTYSRIEFDRLEQQATEIVLGTAGEEAVEHSGPFFVFAADKTLVASNRGRGRSISDEELIPVEYDGSTVGYFYAGDVRFLSDSSNRFVLVSLTVLVGVSMLVSFGIASAFGARSARMTGRALVALRSDLRLLQGLKPVNVRRFEIKELTDVSSTLHEVSSMLAATDKYKQRWMQDIAHDLRSPIAGLKGQLEAMRDGVLDPSPMRFEKTLADVGRLEEMIHSISELQSIEVLQSVQLELIDAHELFEELHERYATMVAERNASMRKSIGTPNLRADRKLLLRAMGNIVENALKYGGEGVDIELSIRRKDDETLIQIWNSGPPIPEDQHGWVFQRFFRGESSRTTAGAGLGLSIAREVVVRHHGTIHVANASPNGVTFTLTIPE